MYGKESRSTTLDIQSVNFKLWQEYSLYRLMVIGIYLKSNTKVNSSKCHVTRSNVQLPLRFIIQMRIFDNLTHQEMLKMFAVDGPVPHYELLCFYKWILKIHFTSHQVTQPLPSPPSPSLCAHCGPRVWSWDLPRGLQSSIVPEASLTIVHNTDRLIRRRGHSHWK